MLQNGAVVCLDAHLPRAQETSSLEDKHVVHVTRNPSTIALTRQIPQPSNGQDHCATPRPRQVDSLGGAESQTKNKQRNLLHMYVWYRTHKAISSITTACFASRKIFLQTLTTVTKFWKDFSQFKATYKHKLHQVTNGNNK